ncbi:MAG: BatA domain-containing protein [Deltaproteobacteria bacterium]|nr:BatA domain-containing protein [Deltaproteobacteria bacterium]
MSLTFAHPAFLWGALAALVPIVIHLINRRRSRQVEFAAIAFVLRSEARHARKLKLKRLILLLLRVAACIGVPLALARPYLAAPAAAGAPTRDARALVLVLDTSFSMRYRLDKKTLFERARAEGGELLDTLGPSDAVTVLPCADGPEGALEKPGYDLARARAALREAQVGYRASDLEACLEAAASLLPGSLLSELEIVVLTDLTATAWSLDAPAPQVKQGEKVVRPRVRVVDVAEGKPLPNHWIESVAAEPAYALGPRGYAFDVALRSSGGMESPGLSVSLVVADKAKVRGFADLPMDSSAHKLLSHTFESGGDRAGMLVLDGDALPEDDQAHFLVKVRQDVRALIVDGEPTTNRFDDEVYFVERALAPARGEGSAIFPTVIDAEGFRGDSLEGQDLVFLLNVGSLGAEAASALLRFVEEGGGLFVSVGSKTDADELNLSLGPVLPAALHLPRAAETGKVSFGAIAWDHPIFGIFIGEGREGFASARFGTYYLTRPPAKGALALATYEDDAPVLLVREVGKGRTALYTSTVDRAWTDFPIRTAFLPVMQQVAGYLAHSLEERRDFMVTLGEPHRLSFPDTVVEMKIQGPGEKGFEVQAPAIDQGEAVFPHTDRPGLYRVFARHEGEAALSPAPEHDFVVRLDPRESDTTRLDPAELEARFGRSEDAAAGLGAVVGGHRPASQPLWSLALALIVLLLTAEGWLLR